MSSTNISFKAKILIGDIVVPVLTEIVRGDIGDGNQSESGNEPKTQAEDGTQNGFLFKLDDGEGDTGITVYLGEVIAFIEDKLGIDAANLTTNDIFATLFPGVVFDSASQTIVNIKAFTFNSSPDECLFDINIDIEGTDPSQGFIALPGEMNNWLKIENLGVAYISDTHSNSGGTGKDTEVEATVGLNLEVGSVPISLSVDIDDPTTQTVYTFDGCEQNADIILGDFLTKVGAQFGLDVVLPPELNQEAKIDYVAGQMIYTKPASGPTNTELGISGRFELILDDGKDFAFNFYADSVIASNAAEKDKSYVIGASFDLNFEMGKLPLIGDIGGIQDLAFTNLGFSYTNVDPASTTNKVVQFNVPQVDGDTNPLYTRTLPADPDPNTPSGTKNATTYTIKNTGDNKSLKVDRGGFSLTAGFTHLSTGETSNNVALPLDLAPATPDNAAPTDFSTLPTSPPNSSVKWMDINKQIGPVNLEQVGLNYSGGEASFGISAEFQISAFMLGLEEMVITFPLPLPGIPAGKDIDFGLAGMTLSIQEPGFEMGASFLRTHNDVDDYDAYYGEASLKIGPLGITALGGYTPGHDSTDPDDATQTIHIGPSLFIYSNIDIPLGGLPCFWITGFSGGFGINNELILPTLENLSDYILLPGSAPPKESTAQSTIDEVLPQLQAYFMDAPGEYWVAAGLSFTSYEMIRGFAMITTSFGVDFEIAIIGSASMTFPLLDPYPVAYFEIDVLASFSVESGLLCLEGALAQGCYIFGPFCKITGGFAFYLWFSGAHKGEFVVTVGGYNSAFVAPDYYPVVPRLGINYVLGPFHVNGSAYFALTPGMFMTGGEVNATWKLADVNAWFSTYADILIAWAPFTYNIDIYINVGCSVNMGLFTINMHVGSELYVWGPPFGGTAHVDLDVITFDITFGSEQIPAAPVGWEDFQNSFLPADTTADTGEAPMQKSAMAAAAATPAPDPGSVDTTNILKGTVNAGLTNSDLDDFDWIIDPHEFAIEISSTVPITQAIWQNGNVEISNDKVDYNGTPTATEPYLSLDASTVPFSSSEIWNTAVCIRPMNINDVESILNFSIKKRSNSDSLGTFSDELNAIELKPQLSDVPAAQWKQNPSQPDSNEDPFLRCALTGFVFAPIPRDPDVVSAVPLLQLLFQAGNIAYFGFLVQAVDTNYTVSSVVDAQEELTITIGGSASKTLPNTDYVLNSLNDSWVETQRNTLLDALNDAGFSTHSSSDVDLSGMAGNPDPSTGKALTDWPEVMKLGGHLT